MGVLIHAGRLNQVAQTTHYEWNTDTHITIKLGISLKKTLPVLNYIYTYILLVLIVTIWSKSDKHWSDHPDTLSLTMVIILNIFSVNGSSSCYGQLSMLFNKTGWRYEFSATVKLEISTGQKKSNGRRRRPGCTKWQERKAATQYLYILPAMAKPN